MHLRSAPASKEPSTSSRPKSMSRSERPNWPPENLTHLHQVLKIKTPSLRQSAEYHKLTDDRSSDPEALRGNRCVPEGPLSPHQRTPQHRISPMRAGVAVPGFCGETGPRTRNRSAEHVRKADSTGGSARHGG